MTTKTTTSFREEKEINPTMKEEEEEKPFVSGDSNYFNIHDERLRRRCSSIKRRSGPPPPTRGRSFKGDITHAASETYLMTAFALKLLSYLGVGYRWLMGLYALGIYAMLLLPGFLHVAYYYFFSRNVRRSIVYGDQPRNRLDLFLPKNTDGLKPVLIFVTGGAWIIGYKAWGALLGLHLSERDVIVVCLDYRNFPQGTISDMVSDVCQGISFVFNNISEYGGDPSRIFLMGQSAGGHISTCALLDQAIEESEGRSVTWSTSQLKAYFGLSGGYNLLNLVDHFHGRGLYRTIFLSIMEGEASLAYFSPEIRIRDPTISDAIPLLPQFILFHGTADCSIPSDESKAFQDALNSVGAKTELILYPGKTHTDLFLQDPMRGDDELFDYTLALIHAGDKKALEKDAAAPPRSRLVPEILIKLAHVISPF